MVTYRKTLFIKAAVACALFQGCVVDSNLDRITTAVTPVDPPLVCGVDLPVEPVAKLSDCSFDSGATVTETLGLSHEKTLQIPVRHLIIVMKENRSFDHIFGKLHDQGRPEVEAVPDDFQNLDLHDEVVKPYHSETTCLGADPDHQWGGMHLGINGGKMNGFVGMAAVSTDSNGHFVMGYYEQSDLPFYYWMANTYALGDRHFSPLAAGTQANRAMFMLGTNDGLKNTSLVTYPSASRASIFSELLDAGYTWGVYTNGKPFSAALGWTQKSPGVHSVSDFFEALDSGKLPNVAFVDGIENVDDDHPMADLQLGEAWTRKIYEHAIKSPQWLRSAMVWTYDESGGFADHVPPPLACAPSDSSADQQYREMGPRVPFVVVSPWAKKHYVSHVTRDHTAVTRFIETVFDLPALTKRDANSDALFDLFDFSCDHDLSTPESPESGVGGCE